MAEFGLSSDEKLFTLSATQVCNMKQKGVN